MATASILTLHHLHAAVSAKEVVRGVSLTIRPGEVHAIMGPNGSGKSTLVNALMGHPAYTVTQGKVTFCGKNLLPLAPHERAQQGLFLAFQYPRDIAGVTLRSFLYAAHCHIMKARDTKKMTLLTFQQSLEKEAGLLQMSPHLLDRPVNAGFSGGEKKKAEILQLRILHPLCALLDETDSGLDVDALRIVGEGVNALRGPDFSALLVTHYSRLLHYIVPDFVHVMVAGRIVESGGAELAHQLEKEGYAQYDKQQKPHTITLDLG